MQIAITQNHNQDGWTVLITIVKDGVSTEIKMFGGTPPYLVSASNDPGHLEHAKIESIYKNELICREILFKILEVYKIGVTL